MKNDLNELDDEKNVHISEHYNEYASKSNASKSNAFEIENENIEKQKKKTYQSFIVNRDTRQKTDRRRAKRRHKRNLNVH